MPGPLAIPAVDEVLAAGAAGAAAAAWSSAGRIGGWLGGLLGSSGRNQLQAWLKSLNPPPNTGQIKMVIRWFSDLGGTWATYTLAATRFAESTAGAIERLTAHGITDRVRAETRPLARALAGAAHAEAVTAHRLTAEVARIDRDLSELARETGPVGAVPTGAYTGATLSHLESLVARLDAWAHQEVRTLGGDIAAERARAKRAESDLRRPVPVPVPVPAAAPGAVPAAPPAALPGDLAGQAAAAAAWVGSFAAGLGLTTTLAGVATDAAATDAGECLKQWCGSKGNLLGLLGSAGDLALLAIILERAGLTMDRVGQVMDIAVTSLTGWLGVGLA